MLLPCREVDKNAKKKRVDDVGLLQHYLYFFVKCVRKQKKSASIIVIITCNICDV